MLNYFSEDVRLLVQWFNSRTAEERTVDHNKVNVFKVAVYKNKAGASTVVVGHTAPPPSHNGMKLSSVSTFLWAGKSGTNLTVESSDFIELSRYQPQTVRGEIQNIFIDLDSMGPVGNVNDAFDAACQIAPLPELTVDSQIYVAWNGFTYLCTKRSPYFSFLRLGARQLPPAEAGFPGFSMVTDRRYSAPATALSTAVLTPQTLYLIPVMLPAGKIDTIGIKTGTVPGGATRVRLGLYDCMIRGQGRQFGSPGRLISESYDIAASSNADITHTAALNVRTPGLHYLALQAFNSVDNENVQVQHHTIDIGKRVELFGLGSDSDSDGAILPATIKIPMLFDNLPTYLKGSDLVFVESAVEPHVWVTSN